MKLEMVDIKSEDSVSSDEIDDNSTTRSSFGASVSQAAVSFSCIYYFYKNTTTMTTTTTTKTAKTLPFFAFCQYICDMQIETLAFDHILLNVFVYLRCSIFPPFSHLLIVLN